MKARIQITAGYKNGKSFLKECFCTQPFKIGNLTEDRSEALLKLMIMSSSPGVLDNDHYDTRIEIEEDAQLQITTQGYQRLFNMKNAAFQNTTVHVKNNASLCFLPHPSVPHKEANYSSVNNIYLQKRHNLIWGEIITCGRKLSGEQFLFTKFHSITNIYLENKLLIKENVLLEPSKRNLTGIGQLEGYTHQSNLIFLNNAADIVDLMEKCRELLSGMNDIEFGISELPAKGFMIRLLGYKGEELFDCHNQLAFLLQNASKPSEKLNGYKVSDTLKCPTP